uniref:REST corepressor n=2 Tax=Parascaris univalens TaxID=6257 RepID=A0A915BAD3_PARUN
MGTLSVQPPAGTVRNLTEVFLLLRNNWQQNKFMYANNAINSKDENMSLVVLDEEAGLASTGMSNRIPPEWVNYLDETQYEFTRIRSRLKQIRDLQQSHIAKPSFVDDVDEQKKIDSSTEEVTQMLAHCQRLIGFIEKADIKHGTQQALMQKNVVATLRLTLNNMANEFRSSQANYLRKIEARKETVDSYLLSSSSGWINTDVLNDAPVDNADEGLTMEQIQMLLQNADIVKERERDVMSVSKSIVELNSLFKDLASMIVDQGTILDRIDYNVEQSTLKARRTMPSKGDEAIAADVVQKVQANVSGDGKTANSSTHREAEVESTSGSAPKNLKDERNSVDGNYEDNQQNVDASEEDSGKDAEENRISESVNEAHQMQGGMTSDIKFLDEGKQESSEAPQQPKGEDRLMEALLSMNDNIKQAVNAESNTDNVLCIDIKKSAAEFSENNPEDMNFLEDDEEFDLREGQQTIHKNPSNSVAASFPVGEDWEANADSLLNDGEGDANTKVTADILDEMDFFEEVRERGIRGFSPLGTTTTITHVDECVSQKRDNSKSERRQFGRSQSKTDEKFPSSPIDFDGEKSREGFGDMDTNNLLLAESAITEDELLGFSAVGEEEYVHNNIYWTRSSNEQLNEDILSERIDQLEGYSIESDIGDTAIYTDGQIISELLKNILDIVENSSAFDSQNRFDLVEDEDKYYECANHDDHVLENVTDDSAEFLDSKEKSMDRLQILEDEGSRRVEHSDESGNEGSGDDRSSMSVQCENDEECNHEKVVSMDALSEETLAASSHSTAYRLPTNLEIREGIDYQCAVEEVHECEELSRPESGDRDYCLWLPEPMLDNDAIDDYLSVALGVYGIEQDRALYILYTCRYDFNVACREIKKRRVLKEEWTEEDISSFLRAFKSFGKQFSKIRKVMPHKSTAQVVNFYYDMKKELHLKAILEQRAEEGIEDDSTNASDSEEQSDERRLVGSCENCGNVDSNLKEAGKKSLCSTCYAYCRGSPRRYPHVMTSFERERNDNKHMKCPLKMVDVVESFADFYVQYFVDEKDEEAASAQMAAEDNDVVIVQPAADDNALISQSSCLTKKYRKEKFKKMMQEKEKLALRERSRCVRMQHEDSLQVEHHLSGGIEKYRQLAAEWTNIVDRASVKTSWSQQEIFEAFLGFRHFGRDFEAIARCLPTKNVDMVKQFYEQHKERADRLIKKYESALEENRKRVDFERLYEVVAPPPEVVELE